MFSKMILIFSKNVKKIFTNNSCIAYLTYPQVDVKHRLPRQRNAKIEGGELLK